jgi:hypothetical protein
MDCFYAYFNIFNLSFTGVSPYFSLIQRRFGDVFTCHYSLDLVGFFDNIRFDWMDTGLASWFLLTHTEDSKSYTEQGIFTSSLINTYIHCHILYLALFNVDPVYRNSVVIVLYVDNVLLMCSSDAARDEFLASYRKILATFGLEFEVDNKLFCTLINLSPTANQYPSPSKYSF